MTRTSVLLGVILSVFASAGEGAPITFGYAGEVLFVGALDPASPFPVEPEFGTPFTGTYTFDSAALDAVSSDPTTGSYASSGGLFGITLDLGGLAFAYSSVSIGVTDGYSSLGPGDQYLVGFASASTVLSLRFTDFSEAMFTGDGLPLLPPALTGLFTELFFTQVDLATGEQIDLGGRITSLVCTNGCDSLPPVPVPEPATGVLVFLALGALGTRRLARRAK